MTTSDSPTILSTTESVVPDEVCKLATLNIRRSLQEAEEKEPTVVTDYMKAKLQEFTFVVCGAPRSGKSTLINAIINKELAPTRRGSSAVTLESKCYSIEGKCPEKTDSEATKDPEEIQQFKINIWDTKGITSWDESIVNIIRENHPMCVILCTSPGGCADDGVIRLFIAECIKAKVFIALVCTNYWNDSDEKRVKVMEELNDLLKEYTNSSHEEKGITYYGNVGLVTMVNSIDYSNKRTGLYQPKKGVNTLIYGIMKSLNEEQLLGWCYLLLENDGFWTDMQAAIQEYFAHKFTYGKSVLWSLLRRYRGCD